MEVQTTESGQVPDSGRGWESATEAEVQAITPKSPKAQALAKQLHQLGGAFLLPHLQLCDAWALTIFAERVRRKPESQLDTLLCKLLTVELCRQVTPTKRNVVLGILPEPLKTELRTNATLFPAPKPTKPKQLLVHEPAQSGSIWRSLFGNWGVR